MISSLVEKPGVKMKRASCSSFDIDAATVVADLHDDAIALLLGDQPQVGRSRLALGEALGLRLDAVLDRIGQHVRQRIGEHVRHSLVDADATRVGQKAHLFAVRARRVAHHAGETPRQHFQWNDAQAERALVNEAEDASDVGLDRTEVAMLARQGFDVGLQLRCARDGEIRQTPQRVRHVGFGGEHVEPAADREEFADAAEQFIEHRDRNPHLRLPGALGASRGRPGRYREFAGYMSRVEPAQFADAVRHGFGDGARRVGIQQQHGDPRPSAAHRALAEQRIEPREACKAGRRHRLDKDFLQGRARPVEQGG